MVPVSLALNWILFLALFPISFFWARRAWRIMIDRNFSEVALKRGMPPPDPERFAPYCAIINMLGAVCLMFVVFGVLAGGFGLLAEPLTTETWTGAAGITIWSKFMLDFMLSRHAHPMQWGRKKPEAEASEGADSGQPGAKSD